MFFTSNTQLPTWAWAIIGIFTIIGIVLGFWSFFSGFKIFSITANKRERIKNPLSGSKDIDLSKLEKYSNLIGVVGFVIDTKNDEYFKSIFVDTTEDASKWVLDMKNEIIKNETKLAKQVNSWLWEKEYTINKINFVLIAKLDSIDETIKWKETLLDELKLENRMFER
ncbi:hypothetical protein STIUS_v1c05800 [Spiroplasma sp. TIUS-1]|uniref:hypothetical protein n=1 Tax=Spiroplasma sp. TIUS-1 TaxID=216963 RepID=UPI0013981EAB|nr:hypothetical protein [Spiroplasma sp. TIUS-1]QHX36134.1 hypothetical protein STIUS_v1c05800 [Spiroplasma sp. TIUS-1]